MTFNGVAAAISGETSSTITTSVPSGATTGNISVTTPDGTATAAFTVDSDEMLSTFHSKNGDLYVFANSGGGINEYIQDPGTSWGGQIVATGSFVGSPSCFPGQER